MNLSHIDSPASVFALCAEVAVKTKAIDERGVGWWTTPEERRPAPDHVADASDAGLGKSTAVCNALFDTISALKAKGLPSKVWLVLPHHGLSEERRKALEESGGFSRRTRVVLLRGRGADDPDQPGKKMCWNLEAVAEALSVGASPKRAVCGSEKAGEPKCEYHGRGFTRAKANEKEQIAAADVIIVLSQALFSGYELKEEKNRLLAAGKLRAVKRATRTLVLWESVVGCVASLPAAMFTATSGRSR